MTLNNLHNKRLAMLLSLIAIVLFVVTFNVHTDAPHYSLPGALQAIFTNNAPSGLIGQHDYQSAQSHCAACELLAIGAVNSTISPAVQIDYVSQQESLSFASNNIICCDSHNTLSSRAPPHNTLSILI